LTIARFFKVDEERIKKSLPEFKALPHRLELVEEINGVRWYNDSKATTPEGAITALDAFDEPIILIAGGYDKNLPFDKLAEKIVEKTKAVILIGQTAPKISEAINNAYMSLRGVPSGRRGNLQNKRDTRYEPKATKVVTLANSFAKPGAVVLLSPACASYDMFENYEQRGQQFTELVKSL
jgi:UDP-N-acetylmuramoylalanine--D-glutamate ligase